MMPMLRGRALLVLASIALPANAYEAKTLSRSRIAGLAAASDAKTLSRRRIAGLAAASLAPRVARADDPAVDPEMLANIQKSRDTWKTNAARRGFAFEAGASMPYVKDDTVGAPDRSAPVHKFLRRLLDNVATQWFSLRTGPRPRPSEPRGRKASGSSARRHLPRQRRRACPTAGSRSQTTPGA